MVSEQSGDVRLDGEEIEMDTSEAGEVSPRQVRPGLHKGYHTVGEEEGRAKDEWVPSVLLVHAALIITQLSFGGGSVVGKFGVHGTNPIVFALIREGIAGPLLCIAATALHAERPALCDIPRLLACGVCVFGNQLCFIVGVKLADSITGSVWQPSQPIFTCALAVLLGYEHAQWRTLLGLLFAISGAVFMVLYGAETEGGTYQIFGHLLFFFNCLGTSGYVVFSKPFFSHVPTQGKRCTSIAERKPGSRMYKPLSVTGWCYIVGSVLMFITTLVFNAGQDLLHFVCHDKDSAVEQECVDDPWRVPGSMWWCLAYWILGNSITAYGAMTWANKYAQASTVSAYTVLQPVTSAVISYIVVAVKGVEWADNYSLEKPGIKDLGIIPIMLGLGVLFAGTSCTRKAEVGGGEGPTESPCHADPEGHVETPVNEILTVS
eukprot:Hpha_TRINITY_DN27333_c0_g1::TRINITY_DN27333_c0_g1_i1::g.535::m.535